MDHVSPEVRSWLMSRVGGKNTSPELRVRKVAHRLGLRYRLHRHDLPGKPDLVFPKFNTVVFVHGCFWHRHANCRKSSSPKSNTQYWQEKFKQNQDRDRRVMRQLKQLGWNAAVIWECETKTKEEISKRLSKILKFDRQ